MRLFLPSPADRGGGGVVSALPWGGRTTVAPPCSCVRARHNTSPPATLRFTGSRVVAPFGSQTRSGSFVFSFVGVGDEDQNHVHRMARLCPPPPPGLVVVDFGRGLATWRLQRVDDRETHF